MKQPENFYKIDNERLLIGRQKVTIDVSKDGFFITAESGWNNVVLFEMDWEKEKYNVKICILGEGTDGWYIHKNITIPKTLMKTMDQFKEFIKMNMIDVTKKTDLTDTTPNAGGVTIIDVIETKHSVPSSSGPNVTYEVTENAGGIKDEWTCTCPAFQYSKSMPQTCKHIKQLNP